jgi:hypothetical protein
MHTDQIVAPSVNERPYQANSNHSVAFAKLVNRYAELYDKWDSLTSDARRKREEAERCELDAHKIREQLQSIAHSIREHMIGNAVGEPGLSA